ncbi:exodeoxyribonuclease VII small subunit [uncultured Helicobacter sp.]|uniref:exodeoxyribonuclease VII small subunit n=1 Tax=uncultured Helicobacter sp. TaxID=175537 RepID=UPI002605B4D0|nr:exodeoxyribonuclease VII small subunit [uncultured Helicobacter sp.]
MEQTLNFEEYLQQAEECLKQLDNEDIGLNEGLEFYKQGMENLQKAQKLLENAQLQCETLKAQYSKES